MIFYPFLHIFPAIDMGTGSCVQVSPGREPSPTMTSPPAPWSLIHWTHGDQWLDRQGMFFVGASLSWCRYESARTETRQWAPPCWGLFPRTLLARCLWILPEDSLQLGAGDASPSLCRWEDCSLRGSLTSQQEADFEEESWGQRPVGVSLGLICCLFWIIYQACVSRVRDWSQWDK